MNAHTDMTRADAADDFALAPEPERQVAEPTASTPAGVAPLVALLASGQLRREDVEDAMALQQAHDAYEAKKAYTAAMARFREIVPTARRSGNNAHLRSRYATRDDIAAAVDRPLAACGMNYRFRTQQQGFEAVTVTCVLTHAAGHFEEESMTLPVEDAKGVSLVQRIGIAEEYGRRRTLASITGVSTGEDDADGAARAAPPVAMASDEDISRIVELVDAIDELSEGFSGRWKASKADELQPAGNPLGLAVPVPAVERIVAGLEKRLTLAREQAEQQRQETAP